MRKTPGGFILIELLTAVTVIAIRIGPLLVAIQCKVRWLSCWLARAMCLAVISWLLLPATRLVADDLAGQQKTSAADTTVQTHASTLTLIDEQGKAKTLTADDFVRLPRRTVKAKNGQTDSEFEGVSLVELLKSVGVVFGKELRGPRAADVIVLEANDGYRVAVALLEIDPTTTEKLALVADRRDGRPLDEQEGPFRLVIPDEKRPVRWIRMIRTIRVLNLKDTPLMESALPRSSAQPK
jgi:hypothetical protein